MLTNADIRNYALIIHRCQFWHQKITQLFESVNTIKSSSAVPMGWCGIVREDEEVEPEWCSAGHHCHLVQEMGGVVVKRSTNGLIP